MSHNKKCQNAMTLPTHTHRGLSEATDRERCCLGRASPGEAMRVPALKAPHTPWLSSIVPPVTHDPLLYTYLPSPGVFALFYVSNRFRTFPFSIKDQCIIFYSGVRGASSFSLAFLLPLSLFPRKKMFVTATLVVIYFTVFIQVGRFYSYLK